MSESSPNYKDTITLPQTNFPMRADLVENEPKRLAAWEEQNLYTKILNRRIEQKAPSFILHDGPPFANGDVHMGTALNKVLKDLVVKSKTMAGFAVRAVVVVEQSRHVAVDDEYYLATASAIAPVGASERLELLAVHRSATVSAIATLNMESHLIDKRCH